MAKIIVIHTHPGNLPNLSKLDSAVLCFWIRKDTYTKLIPRMVVRSTGFVETT